MGQSQDESGKIFSLSEFSIDAFAALKTALGTEGRANIPAGYSYWFSDIWTGDGNVVYPVMNYFNYMRSSYETAPLWTFDVCRDVVKIIDDGMRTGTPVLKSDIENTYAESIERAAMKVTGAPAAIELINILQTEVHLQKHFYTKSIIKHLLSQALNVTKEEVAAGTKINFFNLSSLTRALDVEDVDPELSAAFDKYYQTFRAPHMAEERRAGVERRNMRQVIDSIAWAINPSEWPSEEAKQKEAALDAYKNNEWIYCLLHYTYLEQAGPLAKMIIQRAESGDNNQPLSQVTDELHRLHTLSIGSACIKPSGESAGINAATKILFDRQKDCEAILVQTHEQTINSFLEAELLTVRGTPILAADYIRRAAENWTSLNPGQRTDFFRNCIEGLAMAAGVPTPLFTVARTALPGILGSCSDEKPDSPANITVAPELTPYFLGAFGTSTHELCHHSHHAWQKMGHTAGSGLGDVLSYLDANYCIYIQGYKDFAAYKSQPVEEDPNRFASMFVKALTRVVAPELLLGSNVPNNTGLTVAEMVDLREKVESYLAATETHTNKHGELIMVDADELSRYRGLKTLYQQSPVAAGLLYQQQEAAEKSGAKKGSNITVFGSRQPSSGFPLGMAARFVQSALTR